MVEPLYEIDLNKTIEELEELLQVAIRFNMRKGAKEALDYAIAVLKALRGD